MVITRHDCNCVLYWILLMITTLTARSREEDTTNREQKTTNSVCTETTQRALTMAQQDTEDTMIRDTQCYACNECAHEDCPTTDRDREDRVCSVCYVVLQEQWQKIQEKNLKPKCSLQFTQGVLTLIRPRNCPIYGTIYTIVGKLLKGCFQSHNKQSSPGPHWIRTLLASHTAKSRKKNFFHPFAPGSTPPHLKIVPEKAKCLFLSDLSRNPATQKFQ